MGWEEKAKGANVIRGGFQRSETQGRLTKEESLSCQESEEQKYTSGKSAAWSGVARHGRAETSSTESRAPGRIGLGMVLGAG